MKKLFYIAIFISSFLLFSVASVTDTAYAKENIENDLKNEVEDNLNSLIDSDIEQFFVNLKLNLSKGNLKEWIVSIINGEQDFSFDTLADTLFDSIKDGLKTSLFSLISIMVLSLLASFSSSLTAGFKKEGTKQIIHFAIYGAIIATLTVLIVDIVRTVVSSLTSLNSFIDIIFPLFITLFSALSGKIGASFIEPITLVLSNIVLKIILNVIIPIFSATIIFTFVGNLTNTIKLEKLTKTFRSIANWTLGILFSLLTTFVAMQGIVGASIDTITIKSAKFALSSYIPILGGYLSEGFDIVLASCVLIKNALGLTSFIIIIAIVLTPIIKVLCLSVALKLISSFIEPVGDSKLSSLMFETANNLNILIACLAGVAFVLFITTILLIGAFNGGVV